MKEESSLRSLLKIYWHHCETGLEFLELTALGVEILQACFSDDMQNCLHRRIRGMTGLPYQIPG
jgi:hypothetical protein